MDPDKGVISHWSNWAIDRTISVSMDWFSRENLKRKPMGFYHEDHRAFFPVVISIIQFFDCWLVKTWELCFSTWLIGDYELTYFGVLFIDQLKIVIWLAHKLIIFPFQTGMRMQGIGVCWVEFFPNDFYIGRNHQTESVGKTNCLLVPSQAKSRMVGKSWYFFEYNRVKLT